MKDDNTPNSRLAPVEENDGSKPLVQTEEEKAAGKRTSKIILLILLVVLGLIGVFEYLNYDKIKYKPPKVEATTQPSSTTVVGEEDDRAVVDYKTKPTSGGKP
ncbi:MAG: hypothetical protein WC045_04405 [Patescibacteria group bacterium]